MLQDELPPFPIEAARETVERELGQPVDAVFSSFEPPVAAASLAQVHRATLRETGQVVAVKVLRPGIERAFYRDVDAFHFAATMIEMLAPFARRLRPRAVINHFEGVVQGELDLRMEAAAAAEFAANSARDLGFRVPAVVWGASARRMMTLEWIAGIGLGDVEALKTADTDLVRLSERVIQTFLTHALRDGYFHADMHQGNLKLGPDGALVALDFGIMGRIDAYTRRVYAEILYGFLRRDYARVAEVHFEAGYVPRDRDPDAFAQALRSVGRADLRAGRDADLDGAAARAPVRGDGALRDADADGAHPAAADDGGGRGGGALAQSADEHVGDGAAGGDGLHPHQPRAAGGGAGAGGDGAHPVAARAAIAADGGGGADPGERAGARARGAAGAGLGLGARRGHGRRGAGGAGDAALNGGCGATRWLTAMIATLLTLAATPAVPQPAPSEAKMGFMVTSLSRIDPADGSFDISAFAWIIAPDRTFDPADQLQILARKSAIEAVQQASTGDGSTFTGLRIEATVDQAFSLRDFPFDRQTLRVNVETEVPADRLRFVPDEQDTRLADYLVVNGWNVTGLRFEERVIRYATEFGVWRVPDFSRLTLLIDIERQRSALVIEKFIGYTMALLVTALIFLVPTDQIGVRIGMATTAVFAAVGNRYGLDTLIGAETVFGLVEQLSLIVFIAIFAAIAATLLTYEIAQKHTLALSKRVNLAAGVVVVAVSFALAGLAILHARG